MRRYRLAWTIAKALAMLALLRRIRFMTIVPNRSGIIARDSPDQRRPLTQDVLAAAILLLVQIPGICAMNSQVRVVDQNVSVHAGDPLTGIIKLVRFEQDTVADAPIYLNVIAGKLDVSLPPTPMDSVYVALYFASSRVVRYEIWRVPDVPYPVALDDLRIASKGELMSTLEASVPRPMSSEAGTTVTIDQVVGLPAELAARPLKGPGYATGRVAVTDALGTLESATGGLSDCVRVDGSSGPCDTTLTSTSLTGDVTGTLAATTVVGLQNRPLVATAPTDGQTLVYNAFFGQWAPKTPAAAPTLLAGDVTGSLTTATVAGLQNRPLAATAPADGQTLVYSALFGQWAPKTPAAALTPLAGDVTGTLPAATVVGLQNRPLAATAPADGQTLVYSASTAQWAPKTPAAAPTLLAGDVTGSPAAAMVTGLQNRPLAATAPADGQTLVYSASTAQWTPAYTQRFNTVRLSDTTLVIDSDCTALAPCPVRFGTTTIQYASSASLSISTTSGTGTVLILLDISGNIQVRHNLSQVGCTGFCNVIADPNPTPPQGAIPLWAWQATNGVWNPTGTDLRTSLSAYNIGAGTGIETIDTGEELLISVDPFALPQTWSAQATLAFGSIPNASCAPNLTIGLLGALPGDGILAGWPASLPPGLLGQMSVAQPNFVSVTICNLTGTSTMLPALTYTATIVLSFDTAVSGEALSKLSQITIPIDDRTIMATSVDVCSESRRLRAPRLRSLETDQLALGNDRANCRRITLPVCKSWCTVHLHVPQEANTTYHINRLAARDNSLDNR